MVEGTNWMMLENKKRFQASTSYVLSKIECNASVFSLDIFNY